MPKRGRPRKFDRPSRLVALTLPEDVIDALRARNPDLAHAIVALVHEASGNGRKSPTPNDGAELIRIARRRFLITVNRKIVKHLPGCELVPIGSDAALLSLAPGSRLADLSLAVVDRLEEPGIDPLEREALLKLRAALRRYVRDKKLAHETRTILVLRRIVAGGFLIASNWCGPLGLVGAGA